MMLSGRSVDPIYVIKYDTARECQAEADKINGARGVFGRRSAACVPLVSKG